MVQGKTECINQGKARGGGGWTPRWGGVKTGVKSCWSLSKAAEATRRMQLWAMSGRPAERLGWG